MFGEKAYILMKELDRNREGLSPYNADLLNEINNEIKQLVSDNQDDLRLHDETQSQDSIQNDSAFSSVKVRHASIKRNLRCVLSYHYNRLNNLRDMRWQFGSILPNDVKSNLSASESEWFSQYSNILAQYMRTIGEDGGVNLVVDLKPPKSLYIEVSCNIDYGQFELNDGSVVLLKKNSRHYLPRNECEELIRQGILDHIS